MSGTEAKKELNSEAESHKTKANELFAAKKFGPAVEEYSKAVEIDSSNPIYYGNRAFAHLRLENFGLAIMDADKAVECDPAYVKGYYRRGSANIALGHYKKALKDFKLVVKIRPSDKDARQKHKECEKEVRRQAFEAAIAAEHPAPVSASLNIDDIEVDSSYTGPRFDGDEITAEFVQEAMDYMRDQKKIHRKYVYKVLLQFRTVLEATPTLVDVPVADGKHITVCGDTHGQFYDLLNIFSLGGKPSPENPYLFNGDFVDRGSFSFEVVFTLFAYKLLYPNSVHLNRGNHETKNMNKIYGFEGEVASKYEAKMMELFAELFCLLPLCHVLREKVFVTHGGLFSKDGVKLDDIRKIDRNQEPPDEGLMTEMLWSDPQPGIGRGPSKRGVGVSFGFDVTSKFLNSNGLELLVRSHECKDEGYEVDHNGRCITIFSAPNYCDQMGNKGAFIRFTGPDMKPKFTSYDAVPHPQVKPMAYASNMMSMMNMFS